MPGGQSVSVRIHTESILATIAIVYCITDYCPETWSDRLLTGFKIEKPKTLDRHLPIINKTKPVCQSPITPSQMYKSVLAHSHQSFNKHVNSTPDLPAAPHKSSDSLVLLPPCVIYGSICLLSVYFNFSNQLPRRL
ncbi:hypothetical protein J6590_011272 [Homalodisca vitripennis]|nr:hypothetical protein J6590_011272 [Homalodisca vitripennis]